MQSKQVTTKVSLPDLPSLGKDIVKDNVRAVGALYFTAMFENLKIFEVADKLVESFMNGLLPVGAGSTGKRLFQYWKDSPDRMSQSDRRNLYKRVFGLPGGDEAVTPNREFNDLWIRFVSAVSAYIASEQGSETLNQELLRKAGRDLAANLSLYGWGGTHFAAAELKKQIDDSLRILKAPEIQAAYGVGDLWQLIERISTVELGGSANSVRYRTMAESGATIINWLANNAPKLSRATGPIFTRKVVRKSTPRVGVKSNPTDSDLINSCEQWLAVAGVPDDIIDDLGQPNT